MKYPWFLAFNSNLYLESDNSIKVSFKCLFIEVLQGYSAPYSATSIYIYIVKISFLHFVTIVKVKN